MPLQLSSLAATIIVALAASGDQEPSRTTRHLLDGVRAFREGRFAEALVEFRVVERAPDAPVELSFYLGPTLYKLGRYKEALEVFLGSPSPRDEITEFYLGTTYYQLKLFDAARRSFTALKGRLGPKLAEAAVRYVQEIDGLLIKTPLPSVTDRLFAQAHAALLANQTFTAGAFLEEALLMEARSAPADRPPPQRAATLAEFTKTAKSMLSAGDSARARPLLRALTLVAGTEGDEARHLLPTRP
jgi:tetratricopeptide (TPR) repeat protein